MQITIDSKLEAALNERACQQGVDPQTLALNALREKFVAVALPEPRDEWERQLLGLAKDCGVSLSNLAVSSEGHYD